jgi:hypothetical protein
MAGMEMRVMTTIEIAVAMRRVNESRYEEANHHRAVAKRAPMVPGATGL